MENLSAIEKTYGDCCWYPTLKTRYTIFYGDLNSGNEIEFEVDNQRTRNNDDVRGVIVCKLAITKIPQSIHRDFKNIVCLHISSCEELSEISRIDFRGLERLREIAITGTSIEVIPDDLFNDLLHLEVIELLMNQIKYIGPDTFKPLKKIAYIDLGLNVKINAIFVGDPFKFPEGIDNSDKCETLEQLNKLIAKMKPIGGKRKSVVKKTKKSLTSLEKKLGLVDPSKTHFKNGKMKKCAMNALESIKKAKKQLTASKKKISLASNSSDSSKSPSKLPKEDSKKYIKGEKEFKLSKNSKLKKKLLKSSLKSSEELSFSDYSELSTKIIPKKSKSSLEISKQSSRLSIDSRSSRSSTKVGSSEKKVNLVKKKLLGFDKSRSNSMEKSPRASASPLRGKKKLESEKVAGKSQESLKQGQNVLKAYTNPKKISKIETITEFEKIKIVHDKNLNSNDFSPQPGTKRLRSKSPEVQNKKIKENPRPLPHISIHKDGNRNKVTLVDYVNKVPHEVDEWTEKVGESPKTPSPLKIVIKAIKPQGSGSSIGNSIVKSNEPELKIVNPELKDSRLKLRNSKPELRIVSPKVKMISSQVQKTSSEVETTKSEVKATKSEIVATKSEIEGTNSEVKATNVDVRITKPEILVSKQHISLASQNNKTIAPITIINNGSEIRIKRAENFVSEEKGKSGGKSYGKSQDQKDEQEIIKEKSKEKEVMPPRESLSKVPKSFQNIEAKDKNHSKSIDSKSSNFNINNQEILEGEEAIIGQFIEAAKDVIDSDKSLNELQNKNDYDGDIEEIEVVEEVPIDELPLKLEKIEVDSEKIQNLKVNDKKNKKSQKVNKTLSKVANKVQTFQIERYKILQQGDAPLLEQFQTDQLPEVIHTVDNMLLSEENNQNHQECQILYEEDVISSRNIETDVENTSQYENDLEMIDEDLNYENSSQGPSKSNLTAKNLIPDEIDINQGDKIKIVSYKERVLSYNRNLNYFNQIDANSKEVSQIIGISNQKDQMLSKEELAKNLGRKIFIKTTKSLAKNIMSVGESLTQGEVISQSLMSNKIIIGKHGTITSRQKYKNDLTKSNLNDKKPYKGNLSREDLNSQEKLSSNRRDQFVIQDDQIVCQEDQIVVQEDQISPQDDIILSRDDKIVIQEDQITSTDQISTQNNQNLTKINKIPRRLSTQRVKSLSNCETLEFDQSLRQDKNIKQNNKIVNQDDIVLGQEDTFLTREDKFLSTEDKIDKMNEISSQEEIFLTREDKILTREDKILSKEDKIDKMNEILSQGDQILSLEQKILIRGDKITTQGNRISYLEDKILPLNDLDVNESSTNLPENSTTSREKIAAKIDELINKNEEITNGLPIPRPMQPKTPTIYIRDDIFEAKSNEDQIPSITITSKPDLVVKIGDKNFSLHKSILSLHSEVLAEKLELKPQIKKLELKFIKPKTFEIIRDFMYGHKNLSKNFEILEEIFKNATILKIKELKNLSAKLLIEIIDFDNLGAIFQLGADYDNEEMRKKAFEMAKILLPGQIEKEEQMNDLHILKEFVRLKYLRRNLNEG